MLQRNDSGYPKVFPTLAPPCEVGVGETIEFPTLLPGFTEVGAQAPPVAPEPEPAPAEPEPAAPLLASSGFGIGLIQSA